MLQPTRLISTPFAQEGEKTEIQNVTGEFDNSATYRLGFPPLTMQSIRLGGKPPKGTDFNGVLFDITENISFLCKGGRYQYNAGLSTLIGGYPEGSNLLLDDNVTEVVSTVAGNQNNPNTDMTGWILKPNKTTAVSVADASGETQQQVNYNGGSKWHSRVGGYKENERVALDNGDIVKSTIDGNANDPNVDMTGWVNIGNTITVETIADMLSIQNPVDGMAANVKGYYTSTNFALSHPYKGGGLFHYVSSMSTVNNGVTIFNGWVRKLESLELTTDDAGLIGDGTDSAVFQTTALNNLFEASTDGMTIKILGDYDKITTNIFCQGKSGLKVDLTAGSLKAPRDTWVWKTSNTPTSVADSQGRTSYYQRGLLCFFECPHTEVFGGEVHSVGLNNTTGLSGVDSWQDGDVGVQFHMSDFSSVHDCEVHNTFAWGIHATSSVGCSAYNNYVYDVYHQSGINLCMDSPINNWELISIHSNRIDNVGLYGIEFENYINYFNAECYANTVTNCFSCITMSLGSATTSMVSAHGNTLLNSYYGLWRSAVGIDRSDRSLNFHNNSVNGFYYGMLFEGNLTNCTTSENKVIGASAANYYRKQSADFLIMKIISNNQFLVQKSTFTALNASTGTWYIKGIPVTVASFVDSSEKTGSVSTSGTLLLVTVNESVVTSDMLFHHLHRLVTAGTVAEAGIVDNGNRLNSVISNNTSTLSKYGYLRASGVTTNFADNLLTKNKFYGSTLQNIRINAADLNMVVDCGQVGSSSQNIIPLTMLTNQCFQVTEGRAFHFAEKLSASSATEVSFISSHRGAIVGAVVEFVSGTTTGNITLRVANTSNATATSTVTGASNQILWFPTTVVSNSMTTLKLTLSDTVGNLAYTSARVTLLYI